MDDIEKILRQQPRNRTVALDTGYHSEARDRTSLIMDFVESALSQHAFINSWPVLSNKVTEIHRKFGELYMLIGILDPEDRMPPQKEPPKRNIAGKEDEE